MLTVSSTMVRTLCAILTREPFPLKRNENWPGGSADIKARIRPLSVIGMLTIALGVALPVAADSPPRADVRPWVLDHTAAGEIAEFFVVLREAADLSPASAMAK